MTPANFSKEMRLLSNQWEANTKWPQRLEWLEILGIRGWTGQRIPFRFPIVAICGENGSGKSTILQAAASLYAQPKGRRTKYRYASDFIPTTPWDTITNAHIRGQVRQGTTYPTPTKITKRTERWRGNPSRPKRWVEYIDLSRTQPVAARLGYSRIAKAGVGESHANELSQEVRGRLVDIMGRPYTNAKLALSDADPRRRVPVVALQGSSISGFHQGAGEVIVTELLALDPPSYGLLLIDEIETSLHPRAQRRLIRDLATLCRKEELQIILTTHSPYILDELPPEGRVYINERNGERSLMMGVSPEFAMTKMDDRLHTECDIYVEDERARDLIREILVAHARDQVNRCQFIAYGAANVGFALGEMLARRILPRRTIVFVDGDQPDSRGCLRLPGGDAPERVVFEGLSGINWGSLASLLGREWGDVAEACGQALLRADHKEWVVAAATKLLISPDVLWPQMCLEWTRCCLDPESAQLYRDTLIDVLENFPDDQVPGHQMPTLVPPQESWPQPEPKQTREQATEGQGKLFVS